MATKTGSQPPDSLPTSSTNHHTIHDESVSLETCWRLNPEPVIPRPRVIQFDNDPRLPPIAPENPRPTPNTTNRPPPPLRLPSIASPPPTRHHPAPIRQNPALSSTHPALSSIHPAISITHPASIQQYQRRHTTSDISSQDRSAQLPRIDDTRLRRDVLRKSLSCNDSWLSAGLEDGGTTLPPISEADAACEMADSLLQPRQRAPPLLARPTSLLLSGDVRRNFRRNQPSPPSSTTTLRDRSPLTPRHTRLATLRLPVIEEDTVLPDALLGRPRRRVLRRAGPALDEDETVCLDNERSANGAALEEAQAEMGARLFVDTMTDRMLLQERGTSDYGPALYRGVRASLLTFDTASPLLVSLVPAGRLAPILANTNTSGQKRGAE